MVLPKENHMQLTEAATLDRKSGGADLSRRAVERFAVSLNLKPMLMTVDGTLGLFDGGTAEGLA